MSTGHSASGGPESVRRSDGQVRWGIVGSGMVCHDFVTALQVFGSNIQAVAARELSRAQLFANEHKIPRAYGDYDSLFSDESIDVVYVGAVNTAHFSITKRALQKGKHVLVEKPFMMNLNQTNQILALAKQKNLFVMEGMWTRFLPIYQKLMDVLKSGELGQIQAVQASLGFFRGFSKNLRFFDPNQGGGGILDLGVYLWTLAQIGFSGQHYKSLSCVTSTDEQNIDMSGMIFLDYSEGRMASLNYSMVAKIPPNLTIVGTEGILSTIGRPHCPEGFRVTKIATGEERVVNEDWDRYLQIQKDDGHDHGHEPQSDHHNVHFNYHNSIGFAFEALHVEQCLKQQLTESPQYGWSELVRLMTALDEMRRQAGVSYEADHEHSTAK